MSLCYSIFNEICMVKHQVLLLSFNFRCWHALWLLLFIPSSIHKLKISNSSRFMLTFYFLNSFKFPQGTSFPLWLDVVSFIHKLNLMQFMIISSVIDNVLCLPHIALLQETQIERERLIHGATELFQCKSKWCAAWDDELCLLRERRVFMCLA